MENHYGYGYCGFGASLITGWIRGLHCSISSVGRQLVCHFRSPVSVVIGVASARYQSGFNVAARREAACNRSILTVGDNAIHAIGACAGDAAALFVASASESSMEPKKTIKSKVEICSLPWRGRLG